MYRHPTVVQYRHPTQQYSSSLQTESEIHGGCGRETHKPQHVWQRWQNTVKFSRGCQRDGFPGFAWMEFWLWSEDSTSCTDLFRTQDQHIKRTFDHRFYFDRRYSKYTINTIYPKLQNWSSQSLMQINVLLGLFPKSWQRHMCWPERQIWCFPHPDSAVSPQWTMPAAGEHQVGSCLEAAHFRPTHWPKTNTAASQPPHAAWNTAHPTLNSSASLISASQPGTQHTPLSTPVHHSSVLHSLKHSTHHSQLQHITHQCFTPNTCKSLMSDCQLQQIIH